MEEGRRLILIPTAVEAERLFGRSPVGCENLVELADGSLLGLTGFGLAAAGAVAGAHLARIRPSGATLLGLAGTYDEERAPLGTVVQVTACHCSGIGAGSGSEHVSAREMGFWPAPGVTGDAITVVEPQDRARRRGAVLSVASTSATPEEAARRAERYPDALIEDMESWSVALAARLHGVPLRIVRAVSNRAGDRNKANWQIDQALDALGAA